jgi:hypothetical protein
VGAGAGVVSVFFASSFLASVEDEDFPLPLVFALVSDFEFNFDEAAAVDFFFDEEDVCAPWTGDVRVTKTSGSETVMSRKRTPGRSIGMKGAKHPPNRHGGKAGGESQSELS